VGLSDVERPQLKVRDGFDAALLILAANPSPDPDELPPSPRRMA
jgi:hypothetical protein